MNPAVLIRAAVDNSLTHEKNRGFRGFSLALEISEKTGPRCHGPSGGSCFVLVFQSVDIQFALGRSSTQGIMRCCEKYFSIGHDGLSELDAEAWRIRWILRT